MNLFSILEEAARSWPQDVAVVHKEGICRYADLYSAAESLANELRRLGTEEGDKIGVMFPNGPEYIAVAFAVLRVGGIIISIPPAFKAEEVAYLAREMALDGFCYAARFANLIPGSGRDSSRQVSIFSGRGPLVLNRAQASFQQSEREQLVKINIATIRFSSGTTGKAKGIMVSHASLLERARTYCEAHFLRKAATVLWLRPMARPEIYAFLLQGTKILISDAMDTLSIRRLIQQHSVTHIYAAPMFYRTILQDKNITAEQLQNVRYFLSGGAPLGKPIADVFAAKYGRGIVEHYGLAECAAVLINLSQTPSKRGSVGKPYPGREIRLASLEADARAGEDVGEILVRGPGLFDGYYRPWRLRDEVLEDGWFRTGDVARRDADGYYWIVGRTKDVINVGGVKVFPYEIEEVLLTHPAVEETVVMGVAEARFGEVPHGRVKLRNGAVCTERELLRHVNERVSVFKALRGVEFVEEIPKTVTGKPKRPTSE